MLRVTPDQLLFPPAAVGDTAAAFFTVHNDSLRPITVTGVRLAGQPFAVDRAFPLAIPGCSIAGIRVLYGPLRFGRALDTVTVFSDIGEARVVLRARSPFPVVELDRERVNFGPVARGATAEQIVFVNNPSINTLSIDSISTVTPSFRPVSVETSVPAWDFIAVALLFRPDSAGFFKDTLLIYSNAREQVMRIPLQGDCPAPLLVVPEREILFGQTAITDSIVGRVTIIDASMSSLALHSVRTAGPGFSARAEDAASFVRGKDTLLLPVVFHPRAFGEFTDTLVIESDGGIARIHLRGKSPYPVLLTNRDSLAFGTVRKGSASRRPLVVRNSSINTLRLDSVYTRTKWFTARARKMSVTPVDSLALDLIFVPDGFRTYADTLVIAGNSLNTRVEIPLSGFSPPPLPAVTPGTMDLEPVSLGDTSTSVFYVANQSGVNDLTIRRAQKRSPFFSMMSRLPAIVGCRDSIPLRVRFTVSENAQNAFGPHTDTLRVETDGGTLRVVLRALTPYPVVETSTTDLDFGTVQHGERASIPLWLNNASLNNLRIDSLALRPGEVFSVTGMDFPGTIKKGRVHEFTVAFAPDTGEVYVDTLRIYSNAPGSPLLVVLSGRCLFPRVAEGAGAGIPREFVLFKNYPNPFRGSTTIKFGLPRPANISLAVFNTLGQLVAELANGYLEAGYHTVVFNAGGLSSGLYFYRLQSGDYIDTKKFMVLR